MNTTKAYEAFFYRQRHESPVQCVFVATSADIFDWASVPTKTTKDLRNFQRPEIQSHIDEITDFFTKFAQNSSPSSIVIGFRHQVKCYAIDGKPMTLSEIKAGEILRGRLEIEYIDPVDLDPQQQRTLLNQLLQSHIKQIEGEIVQLKASPVTSLDVTGNGLSTTETDAAPIGTDSEEEEFDELDQDQLLKDKSQVLSALKGLDVNVMDDVGVRAHLEQFVDLAKPGIIIDGQHRVRGTKANNILFTITALPHAAWPELAFQFIVLNKSAKKVPDSLLINIVGNSLNPSELTEIEERLTQSGIPVPLYQGVMKLHSDPDSPFYEKLKFGIQDERGIIDASAAKTKIINFWFKCRLLYPMVEHMLEGKTKSEKLHCWVTSELWYQFLKVFWGTAKELYENNSSLWANDLEEDGKTPSSKLMRVTIVNLTQEAIIGFMIESIKNKINTDPTQKTTYRTEIPDIERFREQTKFFFQRLQPEFFSDWGDDAQGFDGSKHVRDEYKKAVKSIISAEKTINQLKKEGPNQSLLYRKK